MKAGVLQHQNAAGGKGAYGGFNLGAGNFRNKEYRKSDGFLQCANHVTQGKSIVGHGLGAAEIGQKHYLRFLVGQLPQSRAKPFKARGIGNFAILDGNVEIAAHQHNLTRLDIKVTNRAIRFFIHNQPFGV